MTTMIWLSIGITIGVLSPWVIMTLRRAMASGGHGVVAPEPTPVPAVRTGVRRTPRAPTYEAVSVRPCLEACQAAWDQQDKRYLASEAPELPLAGCDVGKCGCRYVHHEDRRGTEDRRDDVGRFAGINPRVGDRDRRGDGKRERRRGSTPARVASYFNDY